MCREMKDSGIEWIGEINNEWSIVKIAKLAQFINGYAFNGEDLTIENEIPVIRIGDIQEGGVNLEGCLKYKKDKRLYNYSIQSKDVLIAMSGATTGKTAFINEVDSVAYINQRVGIIRNSKYSKYINYSLNTGEFKKYIDLLADGSAQPNISTKGIMNYYLALPNRGLDNIINYLDGKVSQINNVISKQKSLIEKYKAYKQSLITETVTKGLNKNVHMKDSGIEWIGKIPNHWTVCRMKNIGESIIGLTYSPDDVSDNGILVLRSSNVQNGEIVYGDDVFVNKNISEKLTTKIGDILICSRNGSRALIGKCAYIDEVSAGKSFGAFMTVFRSEYNRFIYYILNSAIFKFHIGTFLTSTINQLTTSNLSGIRITLPPKDEQQEIVNLLDRKCNVIDSSISKKEQLIEKLESYKKSLIYECVTGKREGN